METACIHINSPIGPLTIACNEQGISMISFSNAKELSREIPKSLKTCVQQLQEYFSGKRQSFDLKLAPEGTAFQQSVWKELLHIPYGETQTYLDIAKALGDEKLTRAVGNANGKNPIAIVVPCHRVIGSNGKLTGYAGGMKRKQFLLQLENPPVQTSLF